MLEECSLGFHETLHSHTVDTPLLFKIVRVCAHQHYLGHMQQPPLAVVLCLGRATFSSVLKTIFPCIYIAHLTRNLIGPDEVIDFP